MPGKEIVSKRKILRYGDEGSEPHHNYDSSYRNGWADMWLNNRNQYAINNYDHKQNQKAWNYCKKQIIKSRFYVACSESEKINKCENVKIICSCSNQAVNKGLKNFQIIPSGIAVDSYKNIILSNFKIVRENSVYHRNK